MKNFTSGKLDSNQEAVLTEQFGKLTKNQQKKVRIVIIIIIVTRDFNIMINVIITVEGDGFALGGGGKPIGCCVQDKLHSRCLFKFKVFVSQMTNIYILKLKMVSLVELRELHYLYELPFLYSLVRKDPE